MKTDKQSNETLPAQDRYFLSDDKLNPKGPASYDDIKTCVDRGEAFESTWILDQKNKWRQLLEVFPDLFEITWGDRVEHFNCDLDERMWVVANVKVPSGPFAGRFICQELLAQRIPVNAQVWRAGWNQWLPITQVFPRPLWPNAV